MLSSKRKTLSKTQALGKLFQRTCEDNVDGNTDSLFEKLPTSDSEEERALEVQIKTFGQELEDNRSCAFDLDQCLQMAEK